MEGGGKLPGGFFTRERIKQILVSMVFLSLGILWLMLYTPNAELLRSPSFLSQNDPATEDIDEAIPRVDGSLLERLDQELTDIQNISAIPFLKHYRNPCWVMPLPEDITHMYKANMFTTMVDNPSHFLVHFEELQGLLQWRKQYGHNIQYKCLPHVYIIGFPKCGTTDLFRKLIKHPQVFQGKRKEYHWWSRRRYGVNTVVEGEEVNAAIPLKDYIQLFDVAAEEIHSRCPNRTKEFNPCVTIDASPSTLWQPVIKTRSLDRSPDPKDMITAVIKRLLPNSKFIAILRNPVDRLYSGYLYFKRDKVQPSPEDFHNKTVMTIELFNICVREQGLRYCCYNDSFYSKLELRLMIGIYHVYLEDWLSVWPREQLLVLQLENYSRLKLQSINRVVEFIGLDALPKEVAAEISYQPPQNSISSIFNNKRQMFPETRTLLEGFYRPYNKMLSVLLKDDKFKWS